nr:BREX-4 system phosphatase PglZ [Succinivibrio dextrinosolvens]
MTLDKIEQRIESLLSSDKRWPVIVDFSNRNDMNEFLYHFNVGSNKIHSVGEFCGEGGTIKWEELHNLIDNNSDNLFIVNLSAYLKLGGKSVLKNTLGSIASKSIGGHVIVVTYQCQNYLQFTDSRFFERGQIIIADDDFDTAPQICLISPELADVYSDSCIGFGKLGEAYENSSDTDIYIVTDLNKQIFRMSLVKVKQLTNGYEILCSKDSRFKNIPESFGDQFRWNGLLMAMGGKDLSYVFEEELGPNANLDESVKQFHKYSDEQRWLYYIALCVLGAKKNSYLSLALSNSSNYEDFPKYLFRSILTVDNRDKDFEKLYKERKEILRDYSSTYLSETIDFCKFLSTKQENAIYYLTDLTDIEKEKIIEWLDEYGSNYSVVQLKTILKTVYPDLEAYLSKYRFKNELLDNYFEEYKYQKVINKLLPGFKSIVEKQAKDLGFVSALKPRTLLFDKIDLNKAHAFFFDALGVEYLGFIQKKCNEYGLSTNILYGRCELPSLTCFNKEFVDICNDKGCHISDIKELDDIKHHGVNNFDYGKTKLPIYLIKELEIIDNLLKKIRSLCFGEKYSKAVILSDHGASRLAVLNETENIWEMESKGEHSGRCCPKNEINTKPDFAIEASNYWVLANYDRFKGSRKANVEVHGGASLEEVAVPIIEITKKVVGIEAIILEEYKTITLAAKEIPVLRVYVNIISNNITIKINGRYYEAKETGNKYIYECELPECSKKGIYHADILNGSNVLSENNMFEVFKKGITEVNLFD